MRISALIKPSSLRRHISTTTRLNYTFVCNVKYCDFVVWTTQEMVVHRIVRDEQLLQSALPKAKQCYMSCILPELLTRSQDPTLQTPVYCDTCTMPQFGKMIMCMMCKRLFHYKCAQVKRGLQNWHCSQCK